jgi:hypothetical protein
LLHNLCRGICELPLWHLNANAAVLLHFALMVKALQSTVQVEPIILLEASNLSPFWSSFAQLADVCHVFFYCPESYLLLETCHMTANWCPLLNSRMRKFLMNLRHGLQMSHRNLAAKLIK